MDSTLIFILLILVVAVLILIFSLLRNSGSNKFKASDGTTFSSEINLQSYERVLGNLKPLYDYDLKTKVKENLNGFDVEFLRNIRSSGFKDIKELLRYKKQLDALVKMIND